MSAYTNAFLQLRTRRLAEATRAFLARGKSVVRCECCQLAKNACICAWRPQRRSECEFVLLMHRDEVLKPTNTGRLVADVLPAQTQAFCWSRTDPDAELLALLADPARRCVLVYPAQTAISGEMLLQQQAEDKRLLTFILLDGTWKQSGRMFHLSRWLESVTCVNLEVLQGRGYAVRKSHQDDYVSTAEAAALCLTLAGEDENAAVLCDYFALFNHHYVATRGSLAPVETELHQRLACNR